MSNKSKKSLPLWHLCEACGVLLNTKDLPKHECESCSVASSLTSAAANHNYIMDQSLFTSAEELKSADLLKHVPESLHKHLCLLSESAMQLCRIPIGDPVEVDCESIEGSTVAMIAWPTKEGSLTSALFTKEALSCYGVCKGDFLQVCKMKQPFLPASEVKLKPVQPLSCSSSVDRVARTFCLSYYGQYLKKGNVVHVKNFGSTLNFRVVEIKGCFPESIDRAGGDAVEDLTKRLAHTSVTGDNIGAFHEGIRFFQISNSTKVTVEDETIAEGNVSHGEEENLLSVIGGSEETISRLREVAELSLNQKGLYPGIRPPRGVLLFGPSGTGKSLIARAVAAEFTKKIIRVHGSELYSKFLGETEAKLREKFKEAKDSSPSVLLLDEIDALCPKRDGAQTEQDRRVVATLLTQTDALPSSGRVLVLATSNKPDVIDPALRRPGRLDVELEVRVPTSNDRLDILQKLLRHTRHNLSSADAKVVADATHGYVGADLASLCSRATLHAMKRIPFTDVRSAIETSVKPEVSLSDFQKAVIEVKPSAMREILIEVPNVRWHDIGGQESLKLQLKQAVEWPLKHPEAFSRLGICPPKGLLMFGPPGCSKTLIAKALATESGLNFISVKGPELFSRWVGESERAVREVFRKARQVAPSIVFLDELDALGGERGGSSGGGSNVTDRVLAQLLTELDGVTPLGHVIVIAATNRPDRIDKALLRPGRLDRIVYVPLPDSKTREEILRIRLAKMPTSGGDEFIEKLVNGTEGYSGAEVVAVCQEAALKALEENLECKEVCWRHFESALSIVTPRTSSALLKLYEDHLQSR